MSGNVGVGLGIVGIHVDAVQNTAQLVLLLAQQAVQTMAEPGVQNLARIGGAHGAHLVGGLDGALHKVGAAIVLHNVGVPAADAAGVFQDIQAVLALVLDVMDGKHGLDAAELVQMTVVQVQEHRHQRGLPVVGVDHIRHKIGIEQHLQNGPAEEGEAFAVVIEAIQTAAAEVVFVVQKIEGHTIPLAGEQAAILAAPAHRHAEVGHVGQLVTELQIAVQRHDHPAIHAVFHKCLGQAARHIAQTAGGGKGIGLAGAKKNIHRVVLLQWGIYGIGREPVESPAPAPGREIREYSDSLQGLFIPCAPWPHIPGRYLCQTASYRQ